MIGWQHIDFSKPPSRKLFRVHGVAPADFLLADHAKVQRQ
jgi:hypothetical protein